MRPTSSAAWPIRTLDEHIAVITQAIEECRKDPTEHAVHRLRTTSRRIEAQLALLRLCAEVPRLRHTGRLRRLLKLLRQRAGKVRDFDVQMESLESLRPPRRGAQWKHDQQLLIDRLKTKRKKAVVRLTRDLHQHDDDLTTRLAELTAQLKSQEAFSLEPQLLMRSATTWFQDQAFIRQGGFDDPARLHAIRKAAKLARYMGENAAKTRNAARRFAEDMETLQEAGGAWHDCLALAGVAAKYAGTKSSLTLNLQSRCTRLLKAYQRLLRQAAA
ncbi:MAG: CHAD domain-containing protein [Edaphobacter sp.]|uniref:CHAD domain-containing protein n=1 Tax=Edaphobacter sp. TaxID=1934404 RepID=UPI00239B5F72|nr:CHAD domain-containing protein [Edaphobacter sp.]MDE1177043.1 CHAD domain-containing protein [Edaphobacter sp.]